LIKVSTKENNELIKALLRAYNKIREKGIHDKEKEKGSNDKDKDKGGNELDEGQVINVLRIA
jgi:hypothetical protein